jgi:hypothetical protein
MTSQSGRSLGWASLLLLVLGGMIGSPEAGLAAAALAALCAIAPALSGSRGLRIAGVVLLLASAGLAASRFTAARRGMDAYRARAERSQASGAEAKEAR